MLSTIEEIIVVACEEFDVERGKLLSRIREREVAWVRHVVMGLARELLYLPYKEIALALGRTDHTTVIHGCEHFLKLQADEWWGSRIDEIRRRLK